MMKKTMMTLVLLGVATVGGVQAQPRIDPELRELMLGVARQCQKLDGDFKPDRQIGSPNKDKRVWANAIGGRASVFVELFRADAQGVGIGRRILTRFSFLTDKIEAVHKELLTIEKQALGNGDATEGNPLLDINYVNVHAASEDHSNQITKPTNRPWTVAGQADSYTGYPEARTWCEAHQATLNKALQALCKAIYDAGISSGSVEILMEAQKNSKNEENKLIAQYFSKK